MSWPPSSPEAAILGRRLLRSRERAALATSLGGAPYASLVLVAADLDASPLLLLSDLAQHSRNIGFDPRVSLLLDGTEGQTDRLAGPRLTVLGNAAASADPRLRERFVARHPSSAIYAGFADFRVYRVVVERGHLVAGFGRIEWIDAAQLLFAGDAGALAADEPAILRRLNEQHGEAIARCAQRLPGGGGGNWQITAVDPEGIELRGERGTARLDFPGPVTTAEAALAALFRLAAEPRR